MQIVVKKRGFQKRTLLILFSLLVILIAALFFAVHTLAAPAITVDLGSGEAGESSSVLDIVIFFGLLALLPSLLIMMTGFTRIIIVLSFLRNALGTQQSPPNQVLIGIALFLTLFVMTPVLREVDQQAYQPYRTGVIDQETAIDRASLPVKKFMLRQTKEKELDFFLSLSGEEQQIENGASLDELAELGLEVITPAFMTSELKRAFTIGFFLYIPFLIIDLVVSSTLMSMGMVMLPPSMISLPFKIMMFVLVDGWNLLFEAIIKGFR